MNIEQMTPEQIDHMPAGQEMNALIDAEIFGAIPLTDDEFEIFRATYLMSNGPHSTQQVARPLKCPLDEPEYYTKLKFRLQWPSDYSSSDAFGASRRVVDKMRADGWLFDIHDSVPSKGDIFCIARFQKWQKKGGPAIEGEAIGETDALAICRAALKAKLMETKHA